MIRVNRALVALGLALLVAAPAVAQTAPPQGGDKPVFISPLRGPADIEVIQNSVVKGTEVVTTIKVKNVSKLPIAGFKCDEIWWTKDRNLVPGGGTYRDKKPFMPGEILTFEIHTVKDAKMYQSQYQFSHTNGTVNKPKVVKKFEEEAAVKPAAKK